MSLPTHITGVRPVDGKTSVITKPIPVLGDNNVLVKIAAAPINPSDVMWLQGAYPGKTKDAFAGIEGVGVVIATGANTAAFQGKRVSFFVGSDQGSWADYAVLEAANLVPLPDAIDDEQGASALVNPLTVELFLHETIKGGHKAIVHNAAASALGRQLVAAARKQNIPLINLVRRAENVATLKADGAEFVVDTTLEGWETEFGKLVARLQPTAYFDPVAGEAGSKIITLLPAGATIFNYGALGESASYTVSVNDLLFKQKTLRGLWLSPAMKDPEVAKTLVTNALTNLATKTYQTTIYKRFPVSKFEEALKEYEANASKGKILLIPDSK